MNKTCKITVIGDIMCEPPLLRQAESGDGYDFAPIFAPMRSLFDEADYVIGNLETPLAGEAAGYTDSLYSFNTPDSLASALKALGVDAVSTANNHCCDRGQDGLVRTLRVLDKAGIAHTGTYADPEEKDRILYFSLGDTRVAVIAYTYYYNKPKAPIAPPAPELERCVNRLKPLSGNGNYTSTSPLFENMQTFFAEKAGRALTWEERLELKKLTGVPIAYADNIDEWEKYEKYIRLLGADITEAKKNADLVLYLPHVGGQFNTEPGTFSEWMIDKGVKLGADAVFAGHSHTIQKAGYADGVPCFYCLGNVSMWPHSLYSVRETLPEYGIAAHLYVSGGKIEKCTFSLFKSVQEEGTPLSVIPCDELYRDLPDDTCRKALLDEVSAIYTRITGKTPPAAILREYPL